MGLDITAYANVQFIEPYTSERVDELYREGAFPLYPNSGFPERADGLKEGIYKQISESDEAYGFRAGSYSGYSSWRNVLCELIHQKPAYEFWHDIQAGEITEGAFIELINFSDCEGTIGPQTSAKLANDFEANLASITQAASEYFQYTEEREWFIAKYQDWWKAFRIASNNGAVHFH